jgi:rubredoxin
MKCTACQYEYEEEIQGQQLVITKGDEPFIWLGRVVGVTDNTNSRSYNQGACPKCGTIKLEL